MKSRFWFSPRIPMAFQDSVISPYLSFNGQLHFRCDSCGEFAWGDIVFGKLLIENQADFCCPNCGSNTLKPFKFSATDFRPGTNAGEDYIAKPAQTSEGSPDPGPGSNARKVIVPDYPRRLFTVIGRKQPFGISANEDAKFIAEYVRSLRSSPEFHLNCIHLVGFIESLFEDLYRADPDALDLLNAISGLMRTVFRETADPDAGYLAIAVMMRGREVCSKPAERAGYGFNICQNIYSVMANGRGPLVELRIKEPLKALGITLARETLAEFDRIGEAYLFGLRAQLKWLLGDILKAEQPTELEIDEALTWFEKALADPNLPAEVADFVRKSALTAQSKRRNLTADLRKSVASDLNKLAMSNVDESKGLQRIKSLDQILLHRMQEEPSPDRTAFAMRCLGEALIYVATSDPKTILRHAGSDLSALVSGFALERIVSGAPLDAVAGVEAFRSLAIEHGQGGAGKQGLLLELELGFKKILGQTSDPVEIAGQMLKEHETRLTTNLHSIFARQPDLMILWTEIWNGVMAAARFSRSDDGTIDMTVDVGSRDWEALECAMNLPLPDAPPGRLRAARLKSALEAGWSELEGWLADEKADRPMLLVGPSMIGSWPIDAAEAIAPGDADALRPVAFSPTISVAAAGGVPQRPRREWQVLLVPYGGSDLNATKDEILGIMEIYDGRTTTIPAERLNRDTVLAALRGGYEVIHFCGHGDFDHLNPMNSRIYFCNPALEDSYITADDLRSNGTLYSKPIVVLSACTSAAVLPNGSNNYLGLAGAFIMAGSGAIIGTRWPIYDKTGLAFSLAFHEALNRGETVIEATAMAKEALRMMRLDEWSAFMTIQV